MSLLRKICQSRRIQYIRDCGLPQDAETVEIWERTLPGPLPEDYRAFLIHFNGGKFVDHGSFDMKGRGVPGGTPLRLIGAENFFWLNAPEWAIWNDLISCQRIHAGRIPPETVVIGESGGSNLILIDYQNERNLVLWERDSELRVSPEFNRVPITKSIIDLFNEVEYEPIEEVIFGASTDDVPYNLIEVGDLSGLISWVKSVGGLEKLPDMGVDLLYAAVSEGFYSGAKWLLQQSATWIPDHSDKINIALKKAFESNVGDILVLLLEFGANPNSLQRRDVKQRPYMAGFIDEWRKGTRTSDRLLSLL